MEAEVTQAFQEAIKEDIRGVRGNLRIGIIGGSHPRHLFLANAINEVFGLEFHVIQAREEMRPEPPECLGPHFRDLWVRHFEERDRAEAVYFGKQDYPDVGYFIVAPDYLNTDDVAEWVRGHKPNVVIVFGSGMIRDPLMSALPYDTVNVHLGLSPRYRGAATLFWPFYFLEPQWAGVTIHKIVREPDAGDILHQCVPTISADDGIHDLAAKAVVKATWDMIDLLTRFPAWSYHRQKATGKNFLARDFKGPELAMIYDVFNNDICRAYLEGDLPVKSYPRLVDGIGVV